MSEESLVQYGTPLEPLDEDNLHISKAPRISEQIVTDKQGKRRFHGAFTGGFSAGFFNSVGSKEGWKPSAFVSSRSKRAEKLSGNDPTAYMDEEDLDVFGIASQRIRATVNYEDPQTHNKRKRNEEWPGSIPGQPVLEELLKPVNVTVGMKLLMKLGWRPGQGIGPRLSKREKRKAETERRKLYRIPLDEKGADESSSDSEEECSVSMLSFAPNDVESGLLKDPKSDQFGLGYEPLERGNILGGLFGSHQSHPLKLVEKRKRVSIRGQAFGVGAFEEDDEDIYTKEDMSNYDFVLGPSEEKTKGKGEKRSRWDARVIAMGEVLEGFRLSSQPLPKPETTPLPSLPSDFNPWHQSNRRRFERKGSDKEKLSSEERKRIISNPPSVEIRSGVKKSEETREETAPSSSSFLNTFVETTSKEEESGSTLSNYKPFAAYPEKQKRYEAYLNVKGKNLKDVFPSFMTEWEREREREEFTKAFSFRKPLSLAMSSRFTSAAFDDQSLNTLSEGLNDMAKRSVGPDGSAKSSLYEREMEEDVKAAKGKMFGRLTQTQCEWHPDKLLCKRFNVPHPFPHSKSVGVPSKPKEKLNIFNFLSTSPTRDNVSEHPEGFSTVPSEKGEGLQQETKDSEENYGLKVPVSDPPTFDLFQAIFQDSDSESEERESKNDPKAVESEASEEEEEPRPAIQPQRAKEREGKPLQKSSSNYRRLESHSSVDDDDDELKLKKEENSGGFVDEILSSRAKGVFKGIDFAALNQYRTEDQQNKEERDTPKHSSISSISHFVNESKGKRRRSSSNSSSSSSSSSCNDRAEEDTSPTVLDDEEEYGPTLPPHMVKSVTTLDETPTEVSILRSIPVSKSLKEIEGKMKKSKKHKSKHSRKKKKSKKKEYKRHR